MDTISGMIATQGQDVSKIEKFIKKFGDCLILKSQIWGLCDTVCRKTILHVEICGGYIVYLHEYGEKDVGYVSPRAGGSHEITMYAWDLNVTKCWKLGYLLSYRDKYDQNKDRKGPLPKKINYCALTPEGQLTVGALMPDDTNQVFLLDLHEVA